MASSERKGIAAAIVAPFFIALSIIITKLASAHASTLLIAGLGSLLSVPVLWLCYRLMKADLQLSLLLTELRTPVLKVLLTRSIIGSALIITGFSLTTAVKAVLLLRLEPVFVFLWSMLLIGEKPQRRRSILLLALIVGSALVVAPGPNDPLGGPNIGDGFVVLSLLFLSYSYIPTEEVVAQASPLGLNLLTNAIGGMILTIAAFAVYQQDVIHLTADGFWLIAAYSLVFPVIGATLYFYAFKSLKPWVIASFLSLEVVYGLLLAVLFMSEKMTLLQITGALIVLVATLQIGRQRAAS